MIQRRKCKEAPHQSGAPTSTIQRVTKPIQKFIHENNQLSVYIHPLWMKSRCRALGSSLSEQDNFKQSPHIATQLAADTGKFELGKFMSGAVFVQRRKLHSIPKKIFLKIWPFSYKFSGDSFGFSNRAAAISTRLSIASRWRKWAEDCSVFAREGEKARSVGITENCKQGACSSVGTQFKRRKSEELRDGRWWRRRRRVLTSGLEFDWEYLQQSEMTRFVEEACHHKWSDTSISPNASVFLRETLLEIKCFAILQDGCDALQSSHHTDLRWKLRNMCRCNSIDTLTFSTICWKHIRYGCSIQVVNIDTEWFI